jgi:DnaK suppressor protein
MIATFLQMMGLGFGKPDSARADEKPSAPRSPSSASASSSAKPARPSGARTAAEKAGRPMAATTAKPVAKAPAKAAPKKLAVTASKTSNKPAASPAAKSAKPTAAPASKTTVTKTKTSPATSASAKQADATATATKKATAAPVAVKAAAPAPTPAPAVVQPPAVPQKSARASSRLAQLTVPSMAQVVASTAAKASYTQDKPSSIFVPPPHMAAKKDPKLANNWKTTPVEKMSDAEVLAMPDSEYMNEKQMAFFRHKLVVLKQDMLNNAGETTEHLREDTVVVPDPADRATIEEEHALELRTRDRERKLLKKIEQSINRIDAGDYGYCDETGEPIGVGRLLARPTATLSLEAQQRRELKQKMFGD